jgi:hypothetical protein
MAETVQAKGIKFKSSRKDTSVTQSHRQMTQWFTQLHEFLPTAIRRVVYNVPCNFDFNYAMSKKTK